MDAIENFSLHGESNVVVPQRDFLKWLESHSPSELGEKVIAYSWNVREKYLKVFIDIGNVSWHLLPDDSGFICFEKYWVPNNCTLLDAFGRERFRLTVPWQLTSHQNPKSQNAPTSFARVGGPCINPDDDRLGEFGVIAWVEDAGFYYFELNYRTGEFLWGKAIRD